MIKNIVLIFVLLFGAGLSMSAQPPIGHRGGGPRMGGGGSDIKIVPHHLTPEYQARMITERMDSVLNLTKKQFDKIYKLHLKDFKQKMNERDGGMPPMGGRPGFGGGGPGGGPGRGMSGPPSGGEFGGGRQQPDFAKSHEDIDAIRKKEEKRQKNMEKKMKKILTEEQYALWKDEFQHMRPIDKPADENR